MREHDVTAVGAPVGIHVEALDTRMSEPAPIRSVATDGPDTDPAVRPPGDPREHDSPAVRRVAEAHDVGEKQPLEMGAVDAYRGERVPVGDRDLTTTRREVR